MVCIIFQSNLDLIHTLFYQSYTQKRPSKKTDKDTGGSAKSADDGEDGGDVGSNGASSTKYVSRPRGTSDAKWRNMIAGEGSSSTYSK